MYMQRNYFNRFYEGRISNGIFIVTNNIFLSSEIYMNHFENTLLNISRYKKEISEDQIRYVDDIIWEGDTNETDRSMYEINNTEAGLQFKKDIRVHL